MNTKLSRTEKLGYYLTPIEVVFTGFRHNYTDRLKKKQDKELKALKQFGELEKVKELEAIHKSYGKFYVYCCIALILLAIFIILFETSINSLNEVQNSLKNNSS